MKKIIFALILAGLLMPGIIPAQDFQQKVDTHKKEIEQYRQQKAELMKDSNTSPLSDSQLNKFDSLSYYPIDYMYHVEATYTPLDKPVNVTLNTSTGSEMTLTKTGTVTFNLGQKTYTMSVFKGGQLPEFENNSQQLFIPFTDMTTGNETYKNGRYLPIAAPKDGKVIIDFNKAMNPYSAYNDKYVSVIPPQQNFVDATVISGERKFEDR